MRTQKATSVFVACTAAFLAACSPVRGGEEPSFSALSSKNLIPNESYSPATAPLAPGTALDLSGDEPQPGAYFNYQSCTAAWSFTLADARTIAVTASHCGKPGDKVWAGTADGDFSYPAEPIGEVIYSDFYAEDSHDLDVAFIEITGSADYYVPGAVDNSVATSLAHLPLHVCKLGRVTDETCGTLIHGAAMAQLNSGDSSGIRSPLGRAYAVLMATPVVRCMAKWKENKPSWEWSPERHSASKKATPAKPRRQTWSCLSRWPPIFRF
ncbi:trypsin [Corynebacterium tuberculostearicum]|uniref:trypsin n=1 Tax=Corynebacterium tuberculostearicum TaxID=38304 RepID=UPI0038D18A75